MPEYLAPGVYIEEIQLRTRSTMDDAFFVRCDRTTMTQDDIENGRMIGLVGVAPVKPAEFVIFRFSQQAQRPDP